MLGIRQLPKLALEAFVIRRYRGIEGWFTWKEALSLYELAKALPSNSTVVEIGSWKGRSTYCLAQGLKDGSVHAIDPFDGSGEEGSAETYEREAGEGDLYAGFCQRMKVLGINGKVKPHRGFSNQFVDAFEKIDLLFIDGDHSMEGCTFDFEHYAPKIPSGGYIAFHDYSSIRKDLGPTHVVEKLLLPSGQYEFVGLFGSLWAGRKI
ncbi:class I SAM-dependent methyltransferase [Verrucomicrobium spinosum]|uniref:class I SAM-dependent methyltransferase n=2 Tax=Verrucomicrobium spinosum TaxID=2736 RepID=UPI0001745D66|nr:class I SAM-dependent methyltransferase [Verrucomicrobium spinosum]